MEENLQINNKEEEEDNEVNVTIDQPEEPEYAPFIDITEFPGYSKYEEKHICCCSFVYFPELKTYFIGQWEIIPWLPLFVYLLAISAFVVITVIGLTVFNRIEIIIILVILFILLFMFLFNFSLVIFEGPGYYPFSLVHDNGNPPSVWAGIQTTIEQYSWVQLQSRPPRSAFFRTAHRYVIRPDHFCGWTSTWVGKRNFKFFILFNFYGMIYLLLFTIYIIRALITFLYPFKLCASFVFSIIYTVLGALFTFMTGNFFFESFIHSLRNETNWEIWNNIDNSKFRKNSWKENLQDVFGDVNMFLWFCPISPWHNKSNAEISADYPTYDD
ncbi:hypothetical protein M9Y10_029262 [Tritrichomonas musculus]|uniref:Palmitoyltransferase n=1 Tax=Tritrichomonas musculus TaxID=1915356 RepID=A0ABR2KPX9_9EUKA